MLMRREVVPPVPPAPFLLILDSRVSAGCDTIAAITPATTPEDSEIVRFELCQKPSEFDPTTLNQPRKKNLGVFLRTLARRSVP